MVQLHAQPTISVVVRFTPLRLLSLLALCHVTMKAANSQPGFRLFRFLAAERE